MPLPIAWWAGTAVVLALARALSSDSKSSSKPRSSSPSRRSQVDRARAAEGARRRRERAAERERGLESAINQCVERAQEFITWHKLGSRDAIERKAWNVKELVRRVSSVVDAAEREAEEADTSTTKEARRLRAVCKRLDALLEKAPDIRGNQR